MTTPARDIGQKAQAAAEEHLDACLIALDAYEESGDLEVLDVSPAVAPFCACSTCEVREVLAAAWPVFLAGYAVELEDLGESGGAAFLREEVARMALPPHPDRTTPNTDGEGVHE